MKIIASNRKARFNYELIDTYEAGIELQGSEVKSLRESNVSLQESYVLIRNQEALILNLHISAYAYASSAKSDPNRSRKLLLHKKQILKLEAKMKLQNLQLVPTKIYFNSKGLIKIKIALAKAKKLYDKRETIKKRDMERKIQRGRIKFS
ncbi:SsrA-binding protein SmpB [Spiroplasma endosymbiont of Agriotes lineatus]|uniref:SsrA-binding protein SmpB n=1 Tax=Spiroplasma endosymbiont of Agriotes lineatus TaxID=3077930 RepID=UPI0030CC86CC